MNEHVGRSTAVITLPHAVVIRGGEKGKFESFGFLSASGMLAVTVALKGRVVGDYHYDTDVSGEWGIDFVIHVPTGFAVHCFRTSPDLDDAMMLLASLDGIDGWERTDWREFGADKATAAGVVSAVRDWRSGLLSKN